jgi:hypothetical protein
MIVEIVKSAIYVLCLITSAACAWLLFQGYVRSSTRLLLWSGLCFAFLAINSLIVVLDIVVLADVDLQSWRHLAALAAVGTLLFGLVWEAD